jgi:DNA primase
MSLPPGFLDELRARVPVSRVIGRKVSWDTRRSNPGKGDFWAPCPFHQEKTASFHVDDAKGFYYCFGCHAKGDALTFLRESENMGFLEAVEVLAREAGMPMPARDPAAKERSDARAPLHAAMEAAQRFYRMQLNTAAAANARAYLQRRGLSAAIIERFGLGFATDQRQGLWTHLSQSGFAAEVVVDAGLCARPEGGGAPYDRFRDRIIFPIRDARDRVIAFGGRAMAEGARAKYLNSPETPLFDKGRTLYNIGPARSAMGKGRPLIVAEGYMDVIALVAAGFEGAVAPLGTAITPEQLQLIWRLSDEPVIALDGDTAGLRAGQRLADLALPMLEAGRGLRFAILPQGQDPDDLLRAGGPQAMEAVIAAAQPMARLLWERETAGHVFDSPERRAALDARLRSLLSRLSDASLRAHYTEAFRQMRRDLFGQGRNERGFVPGFRARGAGRGGAERQGAPLPGTRSSALAASAPVEERVRQGMIVALLFAHPALLPEFEEDIQRLSLPEDLARLQRILLEAVGDGTAPVPDDLAQRGGAALERLRGEPYVSNSPLLRAGTPAQTVRKSIAADLALLSARDALRRELDEAATDIEHLADEGLTWRLRQAAAAVENAARHRPDEREDGDGERRDLSAELQALIDGKVWERRRGPGKR